MKEMKTDSTGYKAIRKISNALSGIFSPLLVPTYGYAIALWTTYISYLPESIRFESCIVILVITALIPMGAILFLMRKGKVTDAALSDKSERVIPYIITILCYFAAAYYLWKMPPWLKMFFIGAAVAAIIDSLINTRWKVSAHMTAMGGLCAVILFIGINHISTVMVMPWISMAVLLSGAVGSARIFLNRHTPGQVYAGWFTGLIVTYFFMTI